MGLLVWMFGCLCCSRRPNKVKAYFNSTSHVESQTIHEEAKPHHTISITDHYSYLDGVYIFDKSRMKVIKTEQSLYIASQEEPVFPTESKVKKVRKRLRSL